MPKTASMNSRISEAGELYDPGPGPWPGRRSHGRSGPLLVVDLLVVILPWQTPGEHLQPSAAALRHWQPDAAQRPDNADWNQHASKSLGGSSDLDLAEPILPLIDPKRGAVDPSPDLAAADPVCLFQGFLEGERSLSP